MPTITSSIIASSLTLGINLHSFHPFHPQSDFNQGLTNQTPGIYALWGIPDSSTRLQFGVYSNSWRKLSAHGGALWPIIKTQYSDISLGAGIVSGYSGRISPYVLASARYSVFDRTVLAFTAVPSLERKVPVFSIAIEFSQ
jgi:hypothetical protein